MSLSPWLVALRQLCCHPSVGASAVAGRDGGGKMADVAAAIHKTAR